MCLFLEQPLPLLPTPFFPPAEKCLPKIQLGLERTKLSPPAKWENTAPVAVEIWRNLWTQETCLPSCNDFVSFWTVRIHSKWPCSAIWGMDPLLPLIPPANICTFSVTFYSAYTGNDQVRHEICHKAPTCRRHPCRCTARANPAAADLFSSQVARRGRAVASYIDEVKDTLQLNAGKTEVIWGVRQATTTPASHAVCWCPSTVFLSFQWCLFVTWEFMSMLTWWCDPHTEDVQKYLFRRASTTAPINEWMKYI